MWGDLLPFAGPTTAGGILLGVIVAILTDRLIPYRTHHRMLTERKEAYERIITSKDQQIDAQSKAIDKLHTQNDELMESARVTLGIVKALPAAAKGVVS